MIAVLALKYESATVEFMHDGWFNATSAAAHYGKRPNDWLSLDSTQEYITVLAAILEVPKEALLKAKRGGNTRIPGNGGTWFHPKLAVPFTRWIDVRFAVWCDLQIDRIIREYANPPRADLLAAKRHANPPLMDALFEWRAEQGKTTELHHIWSETFLCNGIVTGVFKKIDEQTLSNADAALLEQVRDRDRSCLIAGLDYATRKSRLVAFATRERTKRLTADRP